MWLDYQHIKCKLLIKTSLQQMFFFHCHKTGKPQGILLINLSKLRTRPLVLQKPPGDCVFFKLDNFVETSGAQGLILLAGGAARELAASMWWRQGSLGHLHSLHAELSSVARLNPDGLFYLSRQLLTFVLLHFAST